MSVLQQPVLPLDVSVLKEHPVLSLNVSVQQQPVLHLEVAVCNKAACAAFEGVCPLLQPVLPLNMSFLQAA